MNNEEYVCDKCNGKGNLPTKNPDVVKQCPKCYGKKKLDWIENVVGVTKIKASFNEIQKEMMDILGAKIAKQIDDDILKEIIKDAKDQNKEEKKKDLDKLSIKNYFSILNTISS